jgi:SAM-dependent methyltransferase
MQGGGRVDGRTAAGYLYQSAGISRSIRGARTCVDLGCGTGVQLLQLAAVNPRIHFTGVDHCEAMLDVAARTADALGLANLSWVRDDIIHPKHLGAGSFDAVVSTMSLHHLPDLESLERCLHSARSLLSPRGAVYLEDFARLKSPRSVEFFIHRGTDRTLVNPHDPFSTLYRCSLEAAFTRRELQQATRVLSAARLHATFPVSFLCVISTPDRGLDADTRSALLTLRAGLTTQQARDLADLMRAFAWGGFLRDVFA